MQVLRKIIQNLDVQVSRLVPQPEVGANRMK